MICWYKETLLGVLDNSNVRVFVGTLSPVNHKGLHQGWTQTSLYLQVVHFTSHHTTSRVFCCLFKQVYIPRVLNTGTCIHQGDLFYSAGLHRNHSQHRKKLGEVSEKKNAGDWSRRAEISEEEIPGSKRSMYGYILIYPRLERENV